MNNNKKKHTLAQTLRVYKKRFDRLDKQTKIQLIAIATLIFLIFTVAIAALLGKGKNPASDSLYGDSIAFSGSYDPFANRQYQDEYAKALESYSDVVLPENDREDRNYFRETLFIGDSNTEGLAAYNHLSLQYVMGVTGMPIQGVVNNPCIWFVGYDSPVTMPRAVSMLKPRRIIINFGTNNAGGTSTENFIRAYENALQAISDAYPYADIIVESVLPVAKHRDYPNITMQDIDEYNIALAKMCSENDYMFLNTAEVFKDPSTGFMRSEYVAKDGIHLTNDGYKLLLEYVGSHKYITKDTRPARGNIPTRRNPPVVPSSVSSMPYSSSITSSSHVVSSSRPMSSSVHSSSHVISSSSSQSSSSSRSSSSQISHSQSTESSSSQRQTVSSQSSSSQTTEVSSQSSEVVVPPIVSESQPEPPRPPADSSEPVVEPVVPAEPAV